MEAPRNFWNNSNASLKLTQYYFKAAKLSTDKCEAEETVDDVLEVVSKKLKCLVFIGFEILVLASYIDGH